jgi:hypothetical protein
MKINSTLLAVFLGLASVSVPIATQAQCITGSTAARGAVYNLLTAGVGFDSPPMVASYGSSTAANGTYMEWSGTISGARVVVKAHWSGSEAGIADVSGTGTEAFLADIGVGGVVAGTTSSLPTAGMLVTNTVDLALADNALAYSKNPGSTATQTGPLIVVPFVFDKTTNTIADQAAFTNLTDNSFKVLAGGGDELILFTGNPNDTTNDVYLAGRDNNSGTRVNVVDETGVGSTRTISQIELSGGQLVDFGGGVYTTPSGQSSGYTLATSLTNTTATVDYILDPTGGTVGVIAVAYLGLADAQTAEGPPYNAVRLTYDGVPYSASNVENGLYSLWGYEYILRKSGDNGYTAAVASAITNNIGSYTDGYEIPLTDMNVTRDGPPSPAMY